MSRNISINFQYSSCFGDDQAGRIYLDLADNDCKSLRSSMAPLRRAIAEVKQRWSVIRWVTRKKLSRAPLCFGRHVKPLVPTAFAVVSTHQPALGPRGGLWPVLFMCNP
jgi:hypothetical protein